MAEVAQTDFLLEEEALRPVGQPSLAGVAVPLSQLPPELAHKKLMAEQQGPSPIPTIAGAPPTPEWANAAEQFLLGESPYDPVRFLKEKLTTPLPPEMSVFGKTIDTSIQGLLDFLMPGSVPEALIQTGVGYGAGKLISPAMARMTRASKAVRPLAREIADEKLAEALITPEAMQAKLFYEAADVSGKEIPWTKTLNIGKLSQDYTEHLTFAQAQEALSTLRRTIKKLKIEEKWDQAKIATANLDDLKGAIEKTFPGFKQAQADYAKISQTGRIQELVGKKDPLALFELEIRQGRSLGPEGSLLKEPTGRTARFLNSAERQEVLNILEDLGPDPGSHILRQMIEGRIVGGALGGLTGFQHGGATGAAVGGLAGMMVPNGINWAITQALRHPATRAFFKRSMEQKGGLANPRFWQTLGALGERLGMNMFNPPPPEGMLPTPTPAPAPVLPTGQP